MRRLCLAALLLWTVGCGTRDVPPIEESTDPPHHGEAESTFSVACPDLPSDRPDDLVIRFELHDYDRPEALQRYAIVRAGRACPDDEMPRHLGYAAEVCVALDDEAIDALYRELAPLAGVRTRALPVHPHRGGTAVRVDWSDRSCRIGDVSHDIEVAPDDREAYRAADGAVRTAIRAALLE